MRSTGNPVGVNLGIPWSYPMARRLRTRLEAHETTIAELSVELGCTESNVIHGLHRLLGWAPPKGIRPTKRQEQRRTLAVLNRGGNYIDVCIELDLPDTAKERGRLCDGVRRYCKIALLPRPIVKSSRGPKLHTREQRNAHRARHGLPPM